MNYLIVLLFSSLFVCNSVLSFTPTYKETSDFKSFVSNDWNDGNNPSYCKFETRSKNGKLLLRVGVVGSPVDYFGYNIDLMISDLPLKSGFNKLVAVPGNTKMKLSYDGNLLVFSKVKSSKVWSVFYPFSIEIDPQLEEPKSFSGRVVGFKRNIFGLYKTHIKQRCRFK